MTYTPPSLPEQQAFHVLLRSMGVDDAAVAAAGRKLLAHRLEEEKQTYARKSRNLLIACVVFTGLMVFSLASGSAPSGIFGTAVIFTLIIFLLFRSAKKKCTLPDAVLNSPERLLLEAFRDHDSMGEMLAFVAELPDADMPLSASDADNRPRSLFGKVSAALMSLLLVFSGAQMPYETLSGPDGVTIGSVIDFTIPDHGDLNKKDKSSPTATPVPAYVFHEDHAVLTRWTGEVVDGVAEVPAEMNGLPVTEIGERAFENNRSIKKLIVPDTVTTIGSGAFMYCSNLSEIVLPDTVVSIGAQAFQSCSALESFTAPAGLTALRAELFAYCTGLTTVTLHERVTELHARAFNGCRSLRSITLPEGAAEIPAYFFYGCSALNRITLPSTVKEVGAYAFAECSALSSVTMPAAMSGGKISEYAFYNCTSLTSIIIPEGVTKISAHAFHGCSRLSAVSIPGTMKTIGSSAFRSCNALRSISLPQGCSVDERSFKDSPTHITRFSPGKN